MNSKTILATFLVTSFMISFSQSYESHKYETLFSEDNFEVRNYEPVLKAKTYSEKGSNDNFGKLFRYISGYNEKNQKISMTTPVYMKQENEKSMMEFVLPSKFSLEMYLNLFLIKWKFIRTREVFTHQFVILVTPTAQKEISIEKH